MNISAKTAGLAAFFLLLCCHLALPVTVLSAQANETDEHRLVFSRLIAELSGVPDKSPGTEGAQQTAAFIKAYLNSLGFETVSTQTFSTPVRLKTQSRITLAETGTSHDIDPFLSNAVSPGTIAEPGITGPVVYVGKGEMTDFNHKRIRDSVVLMDLDSGGNWLNALSLGARALVYVYQGQPDKFLFTDKVELSPVRFPRFILSEKKAEALFPGLKTLSPDRQGPVVRLSSDLGWTSAPAENIYCMVEGSDGTLKEDLIIVEGFYDTAGFIPGKSPGADEACSIASLLDLAASLKKNPPKRSILLVATAGHGNGLAGMREMIWTLDMSSRQLKKQLKEYEDILDDSENTLKKIESFKAGEKMDAEKTAGVYDIIQDIIKTRIDAQSNTLMQLRLEKKPDEARIKDLAAKRMALKRLEGKVDLSLLAPDEMELLKNLIPEAEKKLSRIMRDTGIHKDNLKSAMQFRKIAASKEIRAILSLHLSSHGSGIGAFNDGWLYEIKDTINLFAPYVKLNQILIDSAEKTARKLGQDNLFKDTLRPSLHRSWQSHFKDTPALGGEVSQLAGFLGISLVTTDDSRQFWKTPWDTPDKVDLHSAAQQSRFVSRFITEIASVDDLSQDRFPRNGFATITGRANFLRHGSVFADAPAPDSIILSFQGPGIFYSRVDETGHFFLKGMATRKLTLHKVIMEGYRFDPATGKTIWAVDKKKTTKARYRLKILNTSMETDLIMFPCSEATVLNLLEPRTFGYMTKVKLLDARTGALPIRYWYSRIDTRSSIISTVFLPPGTRFKLGLSDSLLTQKFILTHADEAHPEGNGYRIDEDSIIAPTQYLAAKDMWALLNPRINNLDEKGINNQKIRDLKLQGNKALEAAGIHYEQKIYDRFFSESARALALADRVYDHVESIQKDVLYGVLFYIVLFAPFAFCLERLVFAFINIYKRIAGFIGILVVLIAVIYNVHPAFDLAYSPIVIILAFFIIGLSAIVSWIIFHHFENEMKRFQLQGKRSNDGEISFLKAFSASFFMGVNNLRRRRVRTALTCTTLIILTFTIMSFTSVKSIRQHSKLLYNDNSPYQGLLLKQMNWFSLPQKASEIIANTLADEMIAAPRAWLETKNRIQSTKIPLQYKTRRSEANGLVGLSPAESEISRLPDHMTRGRWFSKDDRYSVIIPDRMAESLHLPDPDKESTYIRLWSIPFKVIGTFSGEAFDRFRDLDGEPVTPAIFPDEVFQQTTEAEMEAMESGDDIKVFQSRYTHIPFDQTIIIPYDTLMSLGGALKSVALKYKSPSDDHTATFELVDRFGLWLFSGEKKGVFVYSASDNLNYSGLPNVMIPILISMFIVLNTMIGSVQERKREIGIYTSIGMAPSHVSIIFIAEALSYAVLSVVLGYILAQVVVKVFAGTALLSGLTVNYSSLGGVFAMAMVMLVVLLSSIYPSKIAASIAIPDVEKSWELAKAEGNTLSIDLPFLIKSNEESSICGYLYHLFDTHRAVSHGLFSVGRLQVNTLPENGSPSPESGLRPSGRDLTIDFTAWLAPFDLGVMQEVSFKVNHSQRFREYMEIGMTITRKSGEHNTWWRINKRFVNLIRKQFLIWRAMDVIEKTESADFLTAVIQGKG